MSENTEKIGRVCGSGCHLWNGFDGSCMHLSEPKGQTHEGFKNPNCPLIQPESSDKVGLEEAVEEIDKLKEAFGGGRTEPAEGLSKEEHLDWLTDVADRIEKVRAILQRLQPQPTIDVDKAVDEAYQAVDKWVAKPQAEKHAKAALRAILTRLAKPADTVKVLEGARQEVAEMRRKCYTRMLLSDCDNCCDKKDDCADAAVKAIDKAMSETKRK